MRISLIRLDDPDADKLNAELQQEYVARYGSVDVTPSHVDEFAPPNGMFFVGYLDDAPAAMGGWRVREPDGRALRAGDVEIKRMYVREWARGQGRARAILAELERTAARSGHHRMVLETGTLQPEAIGLYRSAGYQPIDGFGKYLGERHSVYFGKDINGLRYPRQP